MREFKDVVKDINSHNKKIFPMLDIVKKKIEHISISAFKECYELGIPQKAFPNDIYNFLDDSLLKQKF